MFTVIGLMLAGMLAGYVLRRKRLAMIQPAITVLIWALLYLLGVEVGGNEAIINSLHTLGMEAAVMTLGGTLGSVTAALLLWKALARGRKARTTGGTAPAGGGSMIDCRARSGNPESSAGVETARSFRIEGNVVGAFQLGAGFRRGVEEEDAAVGEEQHAPVVVCGQADVLFRDCAGNRAYGVFSHQPVLGI